MRIHTCIQVGIIRINEGLDNRNSDKQGCTVLAERYFSADLPQGGLEIPCLMEVFR